MKKILALILAVLIGQAAYADCPSDYMPAFTTRQANELCDNLGALGYSLIPRTNNAIDLGTAALSFRSIYVDTTVHTPSIHSEGGITLRADSDAQRVISFDATSDTNLQFTFGDGTASQIMSIIGSTADSADTQSVIISGGADGSVSRSGHGIFRGNEVTTTGGQVALLGGAVATGHVRHILGHASARVTFEDSAGNTMWNIDDTGSLYNVAGQGLDISFAATGTTIAIQEATGASACSGTATLTAATPLVVSTTCATTGSRVLLTRTSLDADTTGDMAVTTAPNGSSFSVTSETSDTGTINWFIIHESA